MSRDNTGLDFKSFAKMNRFHDETMYITEKIDGTNAQIFIHNSAEIVDEHTVVEPKKYIKIGSRNRYITVEDDNFGFARWVTEHHDELIQLPHGRHYGEWWGCGIQRGYGLKEKKFSMFNQSFIDIKAIIPCIDFVPVLYQGEFNIEKISETMASLKAVGSAASPGFMDVEGVVIYLKKSGIFFKRTFDDKHKWEQQAA